MTGPARRRLAESRWHFQHGPIDCILAGDGDAGAVAAAIERAWRRFAGVLDELVAELPLLRTDLGSAAGVGVAPHGPIARRMVAACRAHARGGRFITAMAAVAGSVAEELIGAFDDPRIVRAWVNDGGDIALRLAPGAALDVGVFTDPAHGLARLAPDGRFRIDAASPVRGLATSGWRGRSFSLGIADSVTVLARSASAADAAATVVGNAVDVDAPGIVRRPANSVRDDSDLGERLVTCAVAPLAPEAVDLALARGAAAARAAIADGCIIAAVLSLQGRFAVEGAPAGAAPAGGRPSVAIERSLAPC